MGAPRWAPDIAKARLRGSVAGADERDQLHRGQNLMEQRPDGLLIADEFYATAE